MIQIIATSEPNKNILIVKAPEEIQKQIKNMLLILDKPNNNKSLNIQKINYISAVDMAAIVQNIIRYKNNQNPGIAIGDNRTNKIIILENPKIIKDLLEVVKKLDIQKNQFQPAYIIKLKNAKADTIQSLINQIK